MGFVVCFAAGLAPCLAGAERAFCWLLERLFKGFALLALMVCVYDGRKVSDGYIMPDMSEGHQ